MARAPGVPVIVTSSQGTNASRLRHNGNNQSDLEAEYASFEASWAEAYAAHPERLLRVDFDLLMSDRDAARAELRRVFAFAGSPHPHPNPNPDPIPNPNPNLWRSNPDLIPNPIPNPTP